MASPVVVSASTGMRSALWIIVLLQLTSWGSADEPVKIHLKLTDQNLNEYGNILNNKAIEAVYDIKKKRVDVDQNKRNDVVKAGRKILYISGDFKEDETKKKLTWGNNKNGEQLAEAVCTFEKWKDNDVFVSVVFPKIVTDTAWGHTFMKDFDRKAKEMGMNIGVGSPRVKVHLGFENDKTKFISKINAIQAANEDILNYQKGNIYVVYDEDGGEMFSFIKDNWISVHTTNEFQGRIREADQLTFVIESTCSVNQGKLSVGNHDAYKLAKILTDLLGKREHPQQRVKVELECGNEHVAEKEEFVNDVISKVKGFDVYGKLPCVILHIDRDPKEEKGIQSYLETKLANALKGSCKQFALRKFPDTWYLMVKVNDELVNKTIDNNLIETVSQAKELSIQMNTHGFFGYEMTHTETVFGGDPLQLAETLGNLSSTLGFNPSQRVELIVYACNAGGENGRQYVETFLKKINTKDKEKKIDEVIAFNGWIMSEPSECIVYVPKQTQHSADKVLNNIQLFILKNDPWLVKNAVFVSEKYKYGRVTFRTKWDNNKSKAVTFPVVPAAEYDLWKLKEEQGH